MLLYYETDQLVEGGGVIYTVRLKALFCLVPLFP